MAAVAAQPPTAQPSKIKFAHHTVTSCLATRQPSMPYTPRLLPPAPPLPPPRAQGDLQQAARDFKHASTRKNAGRTNVVGYLATAGLAFLQQQYKEALS